MKLLSLRIENYRGIREGLLTFDKTTVLFGENDSGRSSIIEALALLLGAPAERFEARLQPYHFHRSAGGTAGPLRLTLKFSESHRAGPSIESEFEFTAQLIPDSEQISTHWRMQGARGIEQDRPETLEWLRMHVPLLWLKPGALTSVPDNEHSGALITEIEDPAIRQVELHHRNLIRGQSSDLVAELEDGARAAEEVLRLNQSAIAGAGPLMSAMASDILSRQQPAAAESVILAATPAHKLGVLLLLGAVIQIARRKLPPESTPILVIENPETNLHPMTLAATWRIIERIKWQKVIATNSGTILGNAPLSSLRRLTRGQSRLTEWAVQPRALSKDALRRVSYHLRLKRAAAMFARCWLLVEGETEYWVLPELARICGYDFAAEGVACVEFAQCGLDPLIKLAGQLGIGWHVLADGDDAGQRYAQSARSIRLKAAMGNVTMLRERDIEHCFWQHGFADVIRGVAFSQVEGRGGPASMVIRKAIEKTSKPFLALSLIEAAASRGPSEAPPVLRQVIESAVAAARLGPK